MGHLMIKYALKIHVLGHALYIGLPLSLRNSISLGDTQQVCILSFVFLWHGPIFLGDFNQMTVVLFFFLTTESGPTAFNQSN